MDDEKDLDKKLAEFDQKVTPEYLLKLAKVKLAERILKGETGLKKEFDELVGLEKQLKPVNPGAAPPASSTQAASPATATGEAAPPSEEDEIGIPQRLRVKRHYPITPAVIEQRRKAAAARRPGSEGNKRNWKGGLFAQDFIQGRIKPCQSTCPIFDECELVSEGYTKPDGVCLDKAAVITTYEALMQAIKGSDADRYDEFNEVSALMIAETMHVSRTLLEDVMRDGGVVKREKYDKNGVLQVVEYVPHPALLAIPKLIADLGLTPREMLATPKAVKDNDNDKEVAKTAAGLMSDMARRARESKGGKPEKDADD